MQRPHRSTTGTLEVWLRPNVRILWLRFALAALESMAALGLTVWTWRTGRYVWIPFLAGIALTATTRLVANGRGLRTARLGYRDGTVLLDIGRSDLVELPLDAVECFFLGQGPAPVGRSAGQRAASSANLVVRLAEAAKDWHEGPCDPRLARWADGYITLEGFWCEPLSVQRVRELNHVLAEAKRARRS